MSSNVLTVVAIFLPLSSLWASANISSRIQPTLGAEIRHNMAGGSGRTGSSSGPFIPGKSGVPESPTNSDTTGDSKNSMLARNHHYDIDNDLEAQGLEEK